jgi:DNA-directed RNA polymerase beta' subunit
MFQYKNPSRIIGIQFGISSPEEIRKAGVVEVVSKDTYINNKCQVDSSTLEWAF